MKLKRSILVYIISLFFILPIQAQELLYESVPPRFAGKVNLLSYTAATFSIGGEMKLSEHTSFDLSLLYNPWEFKDNKKMKHVLIQPEGRYWFCETFYGSFVGVHLHYGKYNIGGTGFTDYMKEHRFEGWLAGGGVSYGYHWILSGSLSLEATVGVGYTHLDYGVHPCEKCGEKIKDQTRGFFGPTRLGVSLIYTIK
ncbi:MAG: DUF3575 domain-containing protein [Tannerellaceae bacterium]|nr:DUF3575 domain-containing protein [Tannerellaceae bacterium]